MKKHIITVLRWIGAVVLPFPGAWLVSMLCRFSSYIIGPEESYFECLIESFATGASFTLIAYSVAPRKGAIVSTVMGSLMAAFIVFCMGVYWRNVTLLSFIDQSAVIVGIIVGIVSAFEAEKRQTQLESNERSI